MGEQLKEGEEGGSELLVSNPPFACGRATKSRWQCQNARRKGLIGMSWFSINTNTSWEGISHPAEMISRRCASLIPSSLCVPAIPAFVCLPCPSSLSWNGYLYDPLPQDALFSTFVFLETCGCELSVSLGQMIICDRMWLQLIACPPPQPKSMNLTV